MKLSEFSSRADAIVSRVIRKDSSMRPNETTFVIQAVDDDNQLNNLLVYLKECSDPGHSFTVVVDPDTRESTKKFSLDGDGAFRITSIKRGK